MPTPAARITDTTSHGGKIVGPGVPTVLIGGLPASVVGDNHVCPLSDGPKPHVGGVVSPANAAVTVLIGGRPATRVGTICICVSPAPNPVAMGCPTVLLGP